MPRTRPTEKLLRVAQGRGGQARSGQGRGGQDGPGRRQQFSATTRHALVEVAGEQFTTHGYAGTSLDTIVAGARVTKGALYHHFTGKQALFESVFESVEADAAHRISAVLRTQQDPWEKAMAGLRTFLDVVQDPTYQRIVIQEGPSVLGYERFREQEERSTFALVQEIVRAVLSSSLEGRGEPDGVDEEMVTTFARIFFGAMSAAGESVSSAEDQAVAVARVEAAIGFIVTGLRTLSDTGVALVGPSPAR